MRVPFLGIVQSGPMNPPQPASLRCSRSWACAPHLWRTSGPESPSRAPEGPLMEGLWSYPHRAWWPVGGISPYIEIAYGLTASLLNRACTDFHAPHNDPGVRRGAPSAVENAGPLANPRRRAQRCHQWRRLTPPDPLRLRAPAAGLGALFDEAHEPARTAAARAFSKPVRDHQAGRMESTPPPRTSP